MNSSGENGVILEVFYFFAKNVYFLVLKITKQPLICTRVVLLICIYTFFLLGIVFVRCRHCYDHIFIITYDLYGTRLLKKINLTRFIDTISCFDHLLAIKVDLFLSIIGIKKISKVADGIVFEWPYDTS